MAVNLPYRKDIPRPQCSIELRSIPGHSQMIPLSELSDEVLRFGCPPSSRRMGLLFLAFGCGTLALLLFPLSWMGHWIGAVQFVGTVAAVLGLLLAGWR